MRTSLRLLGVAAAAATMLAIGSPAFAGDKDHKEKGHKGSGEYSLVYSGADGGDAGNGGNGGVGTNTCPGSTGVLGGNVLCSAGNGGASLGGDAESYASHGNGNSNGTDDD
ncbi:hypothetical protein [Saccharopolyspora shandongensis]|uniref:hypothetical protein n=1 Tax=Saccharopolyspora shandongensis TaxID=418495 RepID=UPI0033E9D081